MIYGVLNSNFHSRYMKRFIHILRTLPIICLYLLLTQSMSGQQKPINYELNFRSISSTGIHSPFWFHSIDYGATSVDPFSAGLGFAIHKELNKNGDLIDYAFGVNAQLHNANLSGSKLWLQEAWIQGRLWLFDLTLGIKEQWRGISDPRLSSGGFLLSQNARPMPSITAGIEDFVSIPLSYDLIQIRGALSHGWFNDDIFASGMMMHHKFLQVRVGAKLPVYAQWGLDHVAQWGGNIEGYSNTPFTFKNFYNIFLGRSGGDGDNPTEQFNSLGNHIISTHIKGGLQLDDWDISVYWENVMEDGPVRLLPWLSKTKKDGLWGISVRNSRFSWLRGLTYEYFCTLDQGGPWHDRDGVIYGGADSYFFNYMYLNGWTHFGRTIGSPLIISPALNPIDQFTIMYNAVRSHHLGLEGSHEGLDYRLMTTYSRYFIDNKPPAYPNFSWMLEVSKRFEKIDDLEFSLSLGGDTGIIPGKTSAVRFGIKKTGILFPR